MFGCPVVLPFACVAWTPSAAAERDAALLRELLAQHGLKRAYVAAVMKLEDERDLSDQLNCRKPLNHYRLQDLFDRHPEIADAYHTARLEARGARVWRAGIVQEWAETARELQALLPDLKALTRTRRMARACLSTGQPERKRA